MRQLDWERALVVLEECRDIQRYREAYSTQGCFWIVRMMTTLKYIIYNSKCLSPAFEEVDLDICREARSFNSEHDITGFLFRSAGYYYQYVEGPHEAVDNLIASIAKDKRHSDFYVLQSGETKNRRFKDWCMGYAHAVEEDLKSVLLPSSSGEEITSAMTTAATQQETVEKT